MRSFTIDAAYAAFEENLKGSLEPGKLADFVVLDKDVMRIAPADMLETSVVLTVLDGDVVYDAGGSWKRFQSVFGVRRLAAALLRQACLPVRWSTAGGASMDVFCQRVSVGVSVAFA